jgi:hypothetical protein
MMEKENQSCLRFPGKPEADKFFIRGLSQAIVRFVGADPDPGRRIIFNNGQRAIVITDAGRPESAFKRLEAERRMPWIDFPQAKIFVCQPLDMLR